MAANDAVAGPALEARSDWPALARRAWRGRRFRGQSAVLAFLVVVSVPIILPYFWMVVIAFTARTGGVSSDVLWTACAVIVPAVIRLQHRAHGGSRRERCDSAPAWSFSRLPGRCSSSSSAADFISTISAF